MEQRMSVKLELLQKVVHLLNTGRFDISFAQMASLLNELNADAKPIESEFREEDPGESPGNPELPKSLP
jgi:hypothetical protein